MGKPRGSKVVSHAARKLRQAVIANLGQLIRAEYPDLSRWAAWERIQDATGISASTLQRIMKGEVGPSTDTLADLARHLGTTVIELITPREEGNPFPAEHTGGIGRARRSYSRNPPS